MPLANVHLTPQLIQAVRDAVDILDIAGGATKLKRSGRKYTGLCPLHKEKTPSFSVDAEQGLFYCFGCSQGGDAIHLHRLLSGDDFPTAIESLAQRYGIPLPRRTARRGPAGEEGPDTAAALAAAEAYFRERLEAAEGPRSYLEHRGFSPALIERAALGYAPASWDALHETLAPRVGIEALIAAGLVGRSERRGGKPFDRFRDRLMFPIRLQSGRLVGFGGRALDDDPAKYVNTPETEGFQKRQLLYGLDRAKRAARESGRLLLVEGYFDQLAAEAAGIEAAVASMGTALTREQAELAARFADEVVIGYDADSAGEEASRKALPVLLAAGLAVRRLGLPEGDDPDSLRQREGEAALAAALEAAPDAVAAEIMRRSPSSIHHQPDAHRKAVRAVTELLATIRDPVLRATYARQAAGRLSVPVTLLQRGLEAGPLAAALGGVPAARTEAENPVISLEERTLELLLGLGEAAAETPELPPVEAFLDDRCRNIFASFRALYEREGRPPAARQVLAALDGQPAELERLARLLLKSPVGASNVELEKALQTLADRWRRRRLQELAVRIDEAQRHGDLQRLEELLNEKTALSRALHRRALQGTGDAS